MIYIYHNQHNYYYNNKYEEWYYSLIRIILSLMPFSQWYHYFFGTKY